MDTCPAEVITRIVEYACCDDFGQTARDIGLVSKYLRAIVEPFEFRTVAVSGFKQLQGVIARIQSSSIFRGPEETVLDTRYLFICEMMVEHADVAEIRRPSRIESGNTPLPSQTIAKKRVETETLYRNLSDEFWKQARMLVGWTAPNLTTLSLQSFENWFPPREQSVDKCISPMVLGILSDAAFPNLAVLTLNHNAVNEIKYFGDGDSSFRRPSIPALQSLQIKSPSLMDAPTTSQTAQPRVHPLLTSVISDFPLLKRLVVRDAGKWTAESALRIIFGEDWRQVLSGGSLPNKLQSVVLQQGMPIFSMGTSLEGHRAFVKRVAGLHVNGLKADHFTPRSPGAGRQEYELLLKEWKECCREYRV